LVIGVLMSEQHQPIALDSGIFSLVSDDESWKEPFFTNRQGKFVIPGVKAGLYRLSLYNKKYLPVKIKVGDDVKNPFDLGRIVVSGRVVK